MAGRIAGNSPKMPMDSFQFRPKNDKNLPRIVISKKVFAKNFSTRHGAKKLRFGKSLHEVLPIFDDDVDLTVVLGPADPTRTFLLEAGCILGIRRSGRMQLTVTFQPGKLREDRGAAGHESWSVPGLFWVGKMVGHQSGEAVEHLFLVVYALQWWFWVHLQL